MTTNLMKNLPASLIVFGAGEGGSSAATDLVRRGASVLGVYDNDSSKWGLLLQNRWRIDKPTRTDGLIAIGSMYAIDIALQLKDLGCRYIYYGPCFDRDRFFSGDLPEEKIHWLRSELQDQESVDVLNGLLEFRKTANPLSLVVSNYDIYHHPKVRARAGMVIIDGGAWVGDTAEFFLSVTSDNCLVVCFEPDDKSLKAIRDDNVIKVSKALFSRDGLVSFESNEHSKQSHIVDKGNGAADKVDAIRLDVYRADLRRQIDLIKLDIEGAERDALAGSSGVLSTDAPDLMISLYHRYDGLWVIPRLIKEINPDYRFYLGHHSQYLFDSVLYASVKTKG